MESSRRVFLPKLAAGERWRLEKGLQFRQTKKKYGVGGGAVTPVSCSLEFNFAAKLGRFLYLLPLTWLSTFMKLFMFARLRHPGAEP